MRHLLFIGATLLAACGQAAAPASAPQSATPSTEISAPQAPTPAAAEIGGGKPGTGAPAAAPSVSAAALIGRWGDNGDCAKDIIFANDGTFRSYTGGQGQWVLNGDRVTMSGAGGTFEVRVQTIDANTLMIFNPDGSVGTSQRC